MAALTNEMGTIKIADEVIVKIAGHSAESCYGLVAMSSKKASDSLSELFNMENLSKGITLSHTEEGIEINMYVVVLYGMSIYAVANSTIEKVKYDVETMTGLTVSKVNLTIEGIRVN